MASSPISSTSLPRIVQVISGDGERFLVSYKVAYSFPQFRQKLERTAGKEKFTTVTTGYDGDVMEKVLQYLVHHQNDPVQEDRFPSFDPWDLAFLTTCDVPVLFALHNAGEEIRSLFYMAIRVLVHLHGFAVETVERISFFPLDEEEREYVQRPFLFVVDFERAFPRAKKLFLH